MKNADFVIEEVANGDRMMADGQYAAAVKYYDKAVAADPEVGLWDRSEPMRDVWMYVCCVISMLV
eukprot:2383165-Rhodomonas_salina.2